MLSARQLLLMRRTRDGAIDIDVAPLGTVALLPDPDFRRRVFRCVGHVGLARFGIMLQDVNSQIRSSKQFTLVRSAPKATIRSRRARCRDGPLGGICARQARTMVK